MEYGALLLPSCPLSPAPVPVPVVTFVSCYPGKRKRQHNARVEDREAERNTRAEERDDRMLQEMQQSNTALMGLVERLVSSLEAANRGVQGQ